MTIQDIFGKSKVKQGIPRPKQVIASYGCGCKDKEAESNKKTKRRKKNVQ